MKTPRPAAVYVSCTMVHDTARRAVYTRPMADYAVDPELVRLLVAGLTGPAAGDVAAALARLLRAVDQACMYAEVDQWRSPPSYTKRRRVPAAVLWNAYHRSLELRRALGLPAPSYPPPTRGPSKTLRLVGS